MRTGRTTQRVVCPSCGELLRPTPELLLGLDGIACKCGFRATDRLPGAQHPKAGPWRGFVPASLGVGGVFALAAAVLAWRAAPSHAVLAATVAAGAGAAAWWFRRRALRYADCARLLGDMVIRRSLVDGVRRIYREQGGAAERMAGAWLAEQGVTSPEFRRDLLRDARHAPKA